MTLGKALVDARKSAGITIDQLSSKTNIRASLLSEFENNNFQNAGGDTYARGHLRSIARIVGANSEELLLQFDKEHAQEARPIHDQLVENNATFALSEKSKITNKQLITFSVVGIIAIFVISFTVNNLKQTASNPKPKPAASAKASATPSASASSSEAAKPNTYSSGTGVSVKLEAVNGSSWLFVSDKNGVTLYSGRASQGQVFDFSSTEVVNLRIGNAGAVKLTVNGKEVPALGGNGEVVDVTYGVNS
jgi:cytoskeleton protein RodZ